MDQYKELSTIRSEVEKVLHEQRLEKIRRDFEKQKYEDERRFNHDRWLEDQKREILAAKLRNQATGKYMNRNNSLPDLTMNDDAPPITAYEPPRTSRYNNSTLSTAGKYKPIVKPASNRGNDYAIFDLPRSRSFKQY